MQIPEIIIVERDGLASRSGRNGVHDDPPRLPDFRAQTLSPFARYHRRLRPLPYHPDVYTLGTDVLLRKDGLKIWRDVGRDDMVRLALRLAAANIVTDFRVVPADDTADSKKVADAVAWMFEQMPGGIVSKLGRVLKAFLYGFSVSEVLYGIVSEGPWAGWTGILDIQYRPPFFFDFIPDSQGNLAQIVQIDQQGRVARSLDLDKAIHYVWEAEESPFIGESLWRSAYAHWFSKQGFMTFGNIQAERYAGKLKIKQTDSAKIAPARFEAIARIVLDDYQNATGIVLPEGMDAEVIQGEANPVVYQELMQFCDKRLVGVAGIPWLAVSEGLRSGSFALADIHLATMGTVHQNPQRDLEALISEGPVRVMCDANWVEPRHRPHIELSPPLEKDRQERIKVAAGLVKDGILDKQPQDQNWYRVGVGLPEIDEKTAAAPAAPPAAPVAARQKFAAAASAADPSLWAMIPLPPDLAQDIAVPGGGAPDRLHLTLAFCGRQSDLEDLVVDLDSLVSAMRSAALGQAPLEAKISGMGRFLASDTSDGLDIVYASVDAPGLVQLRQSVARALADAGCPPKGSHDFTPHATLAQVEPGRATPKTKIEGQVFTIDRFVLDVFGERHEFLLEGGKVVPFRAVPKTEPAPAELVKEVRASVPAEEPRDLEERIAFRESVRTLRDRIRQIASQAAQLPETPPSPAQPLAIPALVEALAQFSAAQKPQIVEVERPPAGPPPEQRIVLEMPQAVAELLRPKPPRVVEKTVTRPDGSQVKVFEREVEVGANEVLQFEAGKGGQFAPGGGRVAGSGLNREQPPKEGPPQPAENEKRDDAPSL